MFEIPVPTIPHKIIASNLMKNCQTLLFLQLILALLGLATGILSLPTHQELLPTHPLCTYIAAIKGRVVQQNDIITGQTMANELLDLQRLTKNLHSEGSQELGQMLRSLKSWDSQKMMSMVLQTDLLKVFQNQFSDNTEDFTLIQFVGESYRSNKEVTMDKFANFLNQIFCQPEPIKTKREPEYGHLRSLQISSLPFNLNTILNQVQTSSSSSLIPTNFQTTGTSTKVVTSSTTKTSSSSTSTSTSTSSSTSSSSSSSSTNSSASTANKEPSYPEYFSDTANKTITSKTLVNREFTNLAFYHQIPQKFLQGQIFAFRGRTLTSSPAGTVVAAIFREKTSLRKFSCQYTLKAGSNEFAFDCEIGFSGDFYLSIFTGSSGKASSLIRKVATKPNAALQGKSLPSLPPTGLKLEFDNNELYLRWDSRYPLTKIEINQPFVRPEASMTYILSNFHNELHLNVKDYCVFQERQQTVIKVSEANSYSESAESQSSSFSIPSTLTFISLERKYAIEDESFSADDIPWIVEENNTVVLSGSCKESIQSQILLQTPEKKFESYQFIPGSSIIPPNWSFRKPIPVNIQGTYIIEVNHKNGYAVLNRPLYVYKSNHFPIVPDFEQRRPINVDSMDVAKTQPNTLVQQRKTVLDLINMERKEAGFAEVELDEDLCDLAQQYAIDQVKRNYSGHYNPEGEGPSDRARKVGIYTAIGENIASNPNLTDSNYRLARSPIHYRNMLQPIWTRVGLGIYLHPSGNFKVVQEFSTRDYSKEPMGVGEMAKIIFQVKKIVEDANSTPLQHDDNLSKTIGLWHTSPNGADLKTVLKEKGMNGFSVRNVALTYNSDAMNILKDGNYFTAPGKNSYGLSVRIIEQEKLQIYAVFF